MMLSRTEMYSFLFAAMVFAGWYYWNEQSKLSEPVENWFVVRNISIPDFVEGENPIMIYDHEQRREAAIRRNVDIHHADNLKGDPICSGRSVRTSGPTVNGMDVNIPFSEFVASICAPKEGSYVANVSWLVAPEGYKLKWLRHTSNVFKVLPKDVVPFTQQDKEQLERAQDLLNNPIPPVEPQEETPP